MGESFMFALVGAMGIGILALLALTCYGLYHVVCELFKGNKNDSVN